MNKSFCLGIANSRFFYKKESSVLSNPALVSKERLLAMNHIIAWTKDMIGILIPSPSDICVIPDNLKRDRVVRKVNDSVTSFISIADTTSKPVLLNLDKSLDSARTSF